MFGFNSVTARSIETVLFVALIMFLFGPGLEVKFFESRKVRDALHLTPFTDVTINQQTIDGDSILVSGRMVKRRCQFKSLTAYVHNIEGLATRVPLDVDPHGVTIHGNRPASKNTQTWGPWRVVADYYEDPIISWAIYAEHTGGSYCDQTNQFAGGIWENYTGEIPQ